MGVDSSDGAGTVGTTGPSSAPPPSSAPGLGAAVEFSISADGVLASGDVR